MKVKIRKSFFETNSSSVHAIIIPNKKTELKRVDLDYYRSGIPNEVKLTLGYYGWEERVLDNIRERIGYIFTGLATLRDYTNLRLMLNLFDRLNVKLVAPEYDYYDMLSSGTIQVILNALEEYRKNKDRKALKNVLEPLIREGEIGIDHNLEFKNIKDSIFSDEEMLIEILFGDTVIITGNDNEGVMTFVLRLVETHPDYKVLIKGN